MSLKEARCSVFSSVLSLYINSCIKMNLDTAFISVSNNYFLVFTYG